MRHPWIAGLAMTLGVLGSYGSGAALTFTCSTVARRGTADPTAHLFKSGYEELSVNSAGDVAFVARPEGTKKRLYLYPAAGAASVIATVGDTAPGGGSFTNFIAPSINDAGDLAFAGDLVLGTGVFVRPAAGVPAAVARNGDPAPGGGTFATLSGVSEITAAGDVAFLATVDGAASGVFHHSAASGTTSAVARVGDATGDGRQFCAFSSVELGDSGRAVLHAMTRVDCADIAEVARDGVYEESAGSFISVVQSGDAAPIAGTTFARFFGVPEMGAGDVVGFRSKTAGLQPLMGLFDFDPAGPATTLLVATGDPAPGTGGFLRTIARAHLTAVGRQAFRGRVASGTSRAGIFLAGGTFEPIVLETDAVPADLFGVGSAYRRIEEDFDIDRSGTKVAFSAKVRDSVRPRGKTGLFRCSGS